MVNIFYCTLENDYFFRNVSSPFFPKKLQLMAQHNDIKKSAVVSLSVPGLIDTDRPLTRKIVAMKAVRHRINKRYTGYTQGMTPIAKIEIAIAI